MAFILIVEDEQLLRWSLEERLAKVGHEVRSAANLSEASECLDRHVPDVLLLDIRLPDGNGLDFYDGNHDRLEGTVVIVMTAVEEVESAVRAMKLGALDFLSKPVDHDELVRLVRRSVSVRHDELEVQAARHTRERELSAELVAESDGFREVLEVANQVAQSDVTTVLIQGETGVGKNVVARYIHAVSPRCHRPLLEVSCAAIPETLLESEFFGHESGAFTDAKARKRGILELADRGTVVLDEVGEIKLELQSKLLQFLEEHRFRRIGSTREIHVDVRVLALTNRKLNQLVDESRFRSDLFYRLNVFPLTVPPLRERPEDILPLARHFMQSLRGKIGRAFDGFERESENLLMSYSWPGNVRELRSAVERAMVLDQGPRISPRSLRLDDFVSGAPLTEKTVAVGDGIVPLPELEHEMIQRALRATGNNQTRAAELLGITRDQLRYRLKKNSA